MGLVWIFYGLFIVNWAFRCYSVVCSPYSTSGPTRVTCSFSICQDTYLFASTCPNYGGSFSGDTYLVLTVNGIQTGIYDDTSGYGLCSTINNLLISTSTCIDVDIGQSCYSTNFCSGTTFYLANGSTPILSKFPTIFPTYLPTIPPSRLPTICPSSQPSSTPSKQPTSVPSSHPSCQPTYQPSTCPSTSPTMYPTTKPTIQPSAQPTSQPSLIPSSQPSRQPSAQPTCQPSLIPSSQPSRQPLAQPTSQPSLIPSSQPSRQPSAQPTSQPSLIPSFQPSRQPSAQPTSQPSLIPSFQPSRQPTSRPSRQPVSSPSQTPTGKPSTQPFRRPTSQPSAQPISKPSNQPSSQPSAQPSSQPTVQPSSGLPLFDFGSVLNNSVVSMNKSKSALLSMTSELTSSVVSNLFKTLSTASSSSSLYTTTQIDTPEVKATVAFVQLANHSGNSSDQMPPLSIPGSSSTISLSQSSLSDVAGGGNAVLSVVSFSQSFFSKLSGGISSVTNASSSGGHVNTVQPVLSSDVISIQVMSGNGSAVHRPVSFVANMSVHDQYFSGDQPNLEIFEEQCFVGRRSVAVFECSFSNILLNLTCTGMAAATIKRSCPVPQRVCSVLSLSSFSVASNDYCHAQVSAGSVLCKCGYRDQNGNSSASVSLNVADSNGAINVAVMTQFVSDGFGGNVDKQAVLSPAEEIVAGSTAVFGTFASILFIGMVLLSGLTWNMSKNTFNKSRIVSTISTEAITSHSKKLESYNAVNQVLGDYIWSSLPICFHIDVHWPNRLCDILVSKHLYLRVAAALRVIVFPDASMEGKDVDSIQKRAILDIVQIITSFVTSCALLALVFDLQYPTDDGSCEAHSSMTTCTLRKTPLDATQTYCAWKEYSVPSAGVLSELKSLGNGEFQVLQTFAIDVSLPPDEVVQCHYNTESTSVSAAVLALIIATLVAMPIHVLLTFLMELIRSKSIQDLLNRQTVSLLSSSGPYNSKAIHGLQTNGSDQMKDNLLRSLWKMKFTDWYHKTIIRTPELPIQVKTNRSLALQLFQANHTHMSETKQQKRTAGASIAKRRAGNVNLRLPEYASSPSVNVTSSPTSPTITTSNQVSLTTSTYKSPLHQMLFYTRDAEFAMVLLQNWLADIVNIVYPENNGWVGYQRPVRLVLDHIDFQFPRKAYATDIARILSMVVILLLNMGSLYFIVTAGAFRGYNWQVLFLSVCLLTWISETWFLRVLDILVVDFYLPSLLLSDVCASVNVMIQSFQHILSQSIEKGNLFHLNGTMTETVATKETCSTSYDIAMLRSHLPESQAVIACKQHMSTFSFLSTKRAAYHGRRWIESLLYWRYWQQYALVRIFSSLLLACIIYLWYGIRGKRETLTTSGFLTAIIVTSATILGYMATRAKKAQTKIQMVLPVSPAVDMKLSVLPTVAPLQSLPSELNHQPRPSPINQVAPNTPMVSANTPDNDVVQQRDDSVKTEQKVSLSHHVNHTPAVSTQNYSPVVLVEEASSHSDRSRSCSDSSNSSSNSDRSFASYQSSDGPAYEDLDLESYQYRRDDLRDVPGECASLYCIDIVSRHDEHDSSHDSGSFILSTDSQPDC